LTDRSDEQLSALMKLDPLAAAEEMTGQPADSMNLSLAIGLGLAQTKSKKMRELLTKRGDVWDGMPLEAYRSTIEAYGFELAYSSSFAGRNSQEQHLIYAHRRGLLLSMDTSNGDRVNSGHAYYCWKMNPAVDDAHLISSGHFTRADASIWAGDHDVREALIFNMERLAANGVFVSPWPERPYLWLLHYMDTDSEHYDRALINEQRISVMPAWVREMIGGAA
jgi:hypothetical protein